MHVDACKAQGIVEKKGIKLFFSEKTSQYIGSLARQGARMKFHDHKGHL